MVIHADALSMQICSTAAREFSTLRSMWLLDASMVRKQCWWHLKQPVLQWLATRLVQRGSVQKVCCARQPVQTVPDMQVHWALVSTAGDSNIVAETRV